MGGGLHTPSSRAGIETRPVHPTPAELSQASPPPAGRDTSISPGGHRNGDSSVLVRFLLRAEVCRLVVITFLMAVESGSSVAIKHSYQY